MRELGSMRQREHQSGFSTVEVLLVVLVVAVLAVGGFVVYQHHKSTSAKNTAATGSSQTATQPQSTTTTQTQQPAAQYLDIKEWGVKLPLSTSISDAYYVIPQGISYNADGKPSGLYVDVTSLNASCGDASAGNTNRSIENAVGEIVRSLPTDSDPVSGKLYTQLLPNGTTIGGYYYGYSSDISGKTCASANTLQSIDSAFATATKNAISASSTAN